MITRRNQELTCKDIKKITETYHAWKGEGGEYKDIYGFCNAVKIEEIRKQGPILTPGRYVGVEEEEDAGIPFDETMKELTTQLKEQMEESVKLDEEIKTNLEGIGFMV